jgi:3-methyladenine DNA glycosylase/8-oxoguanine DNA glycosylase
LARAVLNGDLTFETSMNLQDAVGRVQVVPGISLAMAEYIAMRAYGEPDAFPLPADKAPHDTEAWRPWRAYAAMHLWSTGSG